MTPIDPVWGRYEVSDWPELSVEKTGSNVSTWLEEPGHERRWLHKDTTVPSNGIEQGEDWSELVSTQVALKLGIPCAEARMCTRAGHRGSLSLDVKPPGHFLFEGTVALESCTEVTDYFPHTEDSPGVDPARPDVKRPGHSLKNIHATLRDHVAPPGFAGPSGLDAYDVFAGYLLLDALIANRDRHEQNWATLVPSLTNAAAALAPTYDHASSLGYNLTDPVRNRILAENDGVGRWARRGTAWRFEHVGTPPTLVALAGQALGSCSSDAQEYWHGQITNLDLSGVYDALNNSSIDALSVPASRFATALLEHNHERTRDAIRHSRR